MQIITPREEVAGSAKAAADAVAKVYGKGGVVLDTNTLLDWANNKGTQGLNRDYTKSHADPDGLHTAHTILFHNDSEFRVRVYIKDKDTDVPREALVDVTLEQWDRARKGTSLNIDRLRKAAEKGTA